MTRLIDADALKDDILKSAVMIDDRGIQTGYEIAIELIKRQPTIDAEPVRHGRWIEYSFPAHECIYCSECKEEYAPEALWDLDGNSLPNYCPNCGADMRGESDE